MSRWITIKGTHILIEDGQSVEDAIKNKFNKKTFSSFKKPVKENKEAGNDYVVYKNQTFKPIDEKTISDGDSFVKANMSNVIKPFKREEQANIEKIKSRGGLTDFEVKKAIELANNINKKADYYEPQITKDVVESVKNAGATLYGLDFRKKQLTSLAGKLGSDAKDDNLSLEEVANNIKDAVRYTAILNDNSFVDQYNKIKKEMENKGYFETKCKNNFDLYDKGKSPQKDVNCTFKNKDGYKFEFQFHTVRSQGVKEKYNHHLYEIAREKNTPKEISEKLNKLTRSAGSKVPTPKNINSILTHN